MATPKVLHNDHSDKVAQDFLLGVLTAIAVDACGLDQSNVLGVTIAENPRCDQDKWLVVSHFDEGDGIECWKAFVVEITHITIEWLPSHEDAASPLATSHHRHLASKSTKSLPYP